MPSYGVYKYKLCVHIEMRKFSAGHRLETDAEILPNFVTGTIIK